MRCLYRKFHGIIKVQGFFVCFAIWAFIVQQVTEYLKQKDSRKQDIVISEEVSFASPGNGKNIYSFLYFKFC